MVNGIALGLVEPHKMKFKRKLNAGRSLTDDDLICNLEEEQRSGDLAHNHGRHAVSSVHSIRETGSLKCKSKSATTAATSAAPARPKFSSLRLERHAPTTDVSRARGSGTQGRESDKSFAPSPPNHSNLLLCITCNALTSPAQPITISLFSSIFFSVLRCISFAFARIEFGPINC